MTTISPTPTPSGGAAATPESLARLATELDGELHSGELMRRIYATDASAYQEMPLAVAIPESRDDIGKLIRFAREHGTSLIPRTAGTSLAGQVVGSGIVVDVSRHFTRILEINAEEGWVRVEPGVIRNELNMALQPHGLLFGPETSTQNRAMMGGMLGNNSCGSNSIRYGSVRDHILEVTATLADGSEAVFGPLDAAQFAAKCNGPDCLETRLYQHIAEALGDPAVRERIRERFPLPSIHRRNTGYAIDLLMDARPIDPASEQPFHFGKLIAGSEGTLCFVTEMKLHCVPLPPPVSGLLCAHFENVDQSLHATRIAMRETCYACELIDRHILECTRRSREHRDNRFFIEGDPGAVLVIEIRGQAEAEVRTVTARIEAAFREAGLGYAFPVLFGDDTERIWNLRKAGLGLLSNMPGEAKPAPVIEDTAVALDDLPEYIAEFNRRLADRYGIECVHYAHAGAGEIHLRPIINLKTEEGRQLFRGVAETVAALVREYRGSLSGEHGDGRLRGEFLESMIGAENYAIVRAVKETWDPQHIFNPGKIVDTQPMDRFLRNDSAGTPARIDTLFDWSETEGMLGAADMCNGSGDCRKTQLTGGTMCPSYMATRNERDTTRARANMLRQALSTTPRDGRSALDNPDLKEVLDLCLSCKGCKKECPSTVDMAKLKAEFEQHYQDAHGTPLRSRMIADYARIQRLAALAPWAWNLLFGSKPTRRLLNRLSGFHPDRTIPALPRRPFVRWLRDRTPSPTAGEKGRVWLFADEFTRTTDTHVGIATVELLEGLGYAVDLAPVEESGRTWLSKGLVRRARDLIQRNVTDLAPHLSAERPLIGIEPSALLTFRDEAIDLASAESRQTAAGVAEHALLLDEFLLREHRAGRIGADGFTDEPAEILLHGHCFQKALANPGDTAAVLGIPANYRVRAIPSGCCGMAGAFGYEKEHYDLSMKIGNLVLFPSVNASSAETLVAAPGTSCRHQVHDGTGRTALHPAEILRAALRS